MVAAFAVTDLSSILAMSEKAFKVLAVSDVPVKGRGGLGVKIWPVAKDASAELTGAHVSTAGFIVNDKPRQGAKRPSPAIREKPDRWSQKDPG